MSGRIIFWRNDETSTFGRPPVDSLDNINEFLFVRYSPVDLIVVTRSQVDHDMFISVEEHECTIIVQFVHLVEIRNFRDVDQIENGKILDLFRDSIECLVHSHTFFIMVMAETDTDDTIFFDEDGLVDMPARVKMGHKIRHGGLA